MRIQPTEDHQKRNEKWSRTHLSVVKIDRLVNELYNVLQCFRAVRILFCCFILVEVILTVNQAFFPSNSVGSQTWRM